MEAGFMAPRSDEVQPVLDPIDRIDRQIVRALAEDGRLSVRAVAERVHISRTAANTRMRRLVARGVITHFGAEVDHAAIGLPVSALVEVRIGEVSWPEIAARLRELPYVERVQAVSGDIDIVVTVSAPDPQLLSQAVLRDIHNMPGIVSTGTRLILSDLPGNRPGSMPDVWA